MKHREAFGSNESAVYVKTSRMMKITGDMYHALHISVVIRR